MFSPIYTVVKNNTSESRLIGGFDAQFIRLKKGETIEFPFDAWTKADYAQRSMIVTAYKSGIIDISYRVLSPDGVYNMLPFAPCTDSRVTVNSSEVTASVTTESKPTDIIANMTSKDDHQVTVGQSDETSKAAKALGMLVDVKEPEAAAGSIKVTTAADKGIEKDDSIAVAAGAVVAGEAIKVEQAEKASVEDIGSKFDALTADKKWSQAMELLVSEFGDKVTFNARTIMSLKTFDAVDKKYELTKETAK